jgi:hypothetical protein
MERAGSGPAGEHRARPLTPLQHHLVLRAGQAQGRALPTLARIVSRVDVVDASWASVLNLQDRLSISSPRIMRVLCRVHPHCARLEQAAYLLRLLATVRPDVAAEDGHDLREGMGVRRHGEVGRELDALDNCLASLGWIADQRGDLNALGKGRIFRPLHGIGRYDIRVSCVLRHGTADQQHETC